MKKIKILLVSVIAFLLVGCGYEETKEYELLTVRIYETVSESGTFTTKQNVDRYIEYTYKTEEGTKVKRVNESYITDWKIGEENKVVCEEGKRNPILYITMEKYKELYGLEEEGGTSDD